MTWAWVYLAVSLVGALLVVNAFRPVRHPLLGVPSFFAGWYTAEMPVWHIVWQVAATVAFALEGALGSWPGWVALGVNAAAWTGLVVHARLSGRARHVFSRAEEEVPLPPVEEEEEASPSTAARRCGASPASSIRSRARRARCRPSATSTTWATASVRIDSTSSGDASIPRRGRPSSSTSTGARG